VLDLVLGFFGDFADEDEEDAVIAEFCDWAGRRRGAETDFQFGLPVFWNYAVDGSLAWPGRRGVPDGKNSPKWNLAH